MHPFSWLAHPAVHVVVLVTCCLVTHSIASAMIRRGWSW